MRRLLPILNTQSVKTKLAYSNDMYAQEANELERLIVDNSDLEHLEDLIAEFNIFEVLGVQTRETRHSAFLAWLLDPSGNHGLGDYFLRRFLWQVTSRARAVGMTTTTAFDVDC